MKKTTALVLILVALFVVICPNLLLSQEVVFSESFASATIPEGWTTEEFNFPTQSYVWRFNDPGNKRADFTGDHNISGNFAIIDSHNYGYPGVMNAVLTTPAIDFSGLFNATLRFDQCRRLTNGSAYIQISTDGTTWSNVVHFTNQEGYTTPINSSYEISNYIANESEVYLRWKWEASYVYWAIDNVEIVTYPNPAYPLPARLQYPENNQPFVPLDSSLEWLPELGGAEPTGYNVYIGTTSPPPFVADVGNVTSFQPNLEHNQRYFWRIVPYNDEATTPTNLCALRSFSTYIPIEPGTYSINPDGSGDYVSISAAISKLHLHGVAGPVVFELAPGTYQGPFILENVNGTSETNTVTFKSAGITPDAVLTRSSTTNVNREIFLLRRAKNVRLTNLTFNINVTYDGWGVSIRNDCANIEITNSIFTSNSASNNEFIVAADSNSSIFAEGTPVQGLLVEGNNFTSGSIGLVINGGPDTHLNNIVITNNKFTNLSRGGIDARHLATYQIHGNIVEMNPDGITDSYGIWIRNSSGGFTFSNNRIFNARRYGLRYGSHQNTGEMGMMYNNMLGGGFTNSTSYAMITESAIHNVSLYYNSFNLDSTGGNSVQIHTGSTGLRLVNNSFAYTGLGSNGRAMYVHPNSVAVIDYNNYYSNGGTFVWYGTNVGNLELLKSLDNKNQNSRVGDPRYLSATDLHSYSAQLYSGGTPIAGIGFDIDGDPRDPVSPCIGADEYEPILDNDLAAISVTGPNNIIASIPVTHQVKIANLGLIWQQGYRVLLMRDTGATLASIDVEEAIFPSEEQIFELTWTPPTQGIYRIYGLVILENDDNPHNDKTPNFNVFVQPLTELPSPVVTITRNNNSVTLSWDTVFGATHYRVYVAENPAVENWDLMTTTSNTHINVSMVHHSSVFYVTAYSQSSLISITEEEEKINIPEKGTELR